MGTKCSPAFAIPKLEPSSHRYHLTQQKLSHDNYGYNNDNNSNNNNNNYNENSNNSNNSHHSNNYYSNIDNHDD